MVKLTSSSGEVDNNKKHPDRLLLNLEYLSFFSSKTLITTSCTKYQLEGCMFEALRVVSNSNNNNDNNNNGWTLPSEGCARVHDEILVHRSKNGTLTHVDSFTHKNLKKKQTQSVTAS